MNRSSKPKVGTASRVLIVEDGYTRGALAATRALARAGWTVGIGSPKRKGHAISSRYSSEWHEVPSVEHDLERFIEATNRAVHQGAYEVVFCIADAEVLGLSLGRDKIDAVIPLPPHETVVNAFDKLTLTELAGRAGLAAPKTAVARIGDLGDFGLPVIVKARLHWTPGGGAAPARLRADLCRSADEVDRMVEEIESHGGQAVLQEVVHGDMLHFITVVDGNGDPLVSVQTISEPLYFPGPDAGQRVRSVTVQLDADLERKVCAFLAELGWVGLASVMFLVAPGGEPQLVDFNGRFVASFDASIAAGPNFPDLAARVATGRELPVVPPAHTGVRYQWLEGDLRRAFRQRREGLMHDVVDCLKYARGATHTLWRRDDPMPALRSAGRLAKLAAVNTGDVIRPRNR